MTENSLSSMASCQYSQLNQMFFGNSVLHHRSQIFRLPGSFESLTKHCHSKSFKVFQPEIHTHSQKTVRVQQAIMLCVVAAYQQLITGSSLSQIRASGTVSGSAHNKFTHTLWCVYITSDLLRTKYEKASKTSLKNKEEAGNVTQNEEEG